MPAMLIDPCSKSQWDRLTERLAKVHPTVWAAIVAGIFALVTLWIGSCLRSTKLQERIGVMSQTISDRDAEILRQAGEIQRLETLLSPFKTVALQRYTDPEPEALRRLAQQISEVQASVEPRSLTSQQADSLQTLLERFPKGGVSIVSRLLDGEAKDYAEGIGAVFQKAGWQVRYSPSLLDDVTGLGVCSYGSDEKLPGHDTLRNALVRAGIRCGDVSIREKSTNLGHAKAIVLVVGRRG